MKFGSGFLKFISILLVNSESRSAMHNTIGQLRDANWWIFGKPRRELRPALTVCRDISLQWKHPSIGVFLFLDDEFCRDNKL